MNYEDFAERKRRTQSVLDLISERHSSHVAGEWAMNCTPIPCGLPNDEMLEDGLKLAKGEVTLGDLLAKTEAEMQRILAAERCSLLPSEGRDR